MEAQSAESADVRARYQPILGHSSHRCIHGTDTIMYLCDKCFEIRRLEAREDRLYEVLDRLAAAIDGLSASTTGSGAQAAPPEKP